MAFPRKGHLEMEPVPVAMHLTLHGGGSWWLLGRRGQVGRARGVWAGKSSVAGAAGTDVDAGQNCQSCATCGGVLAWGCEEVVGGGRRWSAIPNAVVSKSSARCCTGTCMLLVQQCRFLSRLHSVHRGTAGLCMCIRTGFSCVHVECSQASRVEARRLPRAGLGRRLNVSNLTEKAWYARGCGPSFACHDGERSGVCRFNLAPLDPGIRSIHLKARLPTRSCETNTGFRLRCTWVSVFHKSVNKAIVYTPVSEFVWLRTLNACMPAR